MADDFDVPIDELLSAPIRAIQEAQVAAEREFVDFLVEYGFDKVTEKEGGKQVEKLKVRNVEFDMKKSFSDPTNPGALVEREAHISTPLLAMINLPTISIEEATVDLSLDVEIDQSTTGNAKSKTAASSGPAAELKKPVLPVRKIEPVRMIGVVGNSSVARNFRSKGKLNISMKLVSTRNSDNIDRLARLFNEATTISVGDGQ